MTRKSLALVSILPLLLLVALAPVDASDALAGLRERPVAPQLYAACAPCATCADRTPILEVGRPPLPGEDGVGVASCALVQTSAEWDVYCANQSIPGCPLLDDEFFSERTVVVVVIDTLTPRPCEGSQDPLWKLDCVQARRGAISARVVRQEPGGWCLCSAMPQQLQRLFLASAVPKTQATVCRACEEGHTIGCLR